MKKGKFKDGTQVCGVYWKRLKESAMKEDSSTDHIEVNTFAESLLVQ